MGAPRKRYCWPGDRDPPSACSTPSAEHGRRHVDVSTLCEGLRMMAAPPHPDGAHLREGEPALRRGNAARLKTTHRRLPTPTTRWSQQRCSRRLLCSETCCLYSVVPSGHQLHDSSKLLLQTLTPLSPYWSSTSVRLCDSHWSSHYVLTLVVLTPLCLQDPRCEAPCQVAPCCHR